MSDAVEALARELHDHHAPTADHSHRLASLGRTLAERLGLDPIASAEVELVGVLHDVGKLTIERELLDWEGPLTPVQRARVRRHTIAGEELLTQIAGFEHLAPIVRATHEAWDGSGYPDGLRGVAIPLTARIVAAADCFDAMTSDRAYRTALSRSEACRRLRAASGAQLEPRVVAALLQVVARGAARRSQGRA